MEACLVVISLFHNNCGIILMAFPTLRVIYSCIAILSSTSIKIVLGIKDANERNAVRHEIHEIACRCIMCIFPVSSALSQKILRLSFVSYDILLCFLHIICCYCGTCVPCYWLGCSMVTAAVLQWSNGNRQFSSSKT